MTHKKMRHKLAQGMRKESTDTEKQLWIHLRRDQLGGHHFRRQVPIDRYIVDFVCLEKRLVVELDGGYHLSKDQAEYDVVRDDWMRQQSFRVLRFWNHEVREDVERVLLQIRQHL